ncbi:MAG: polynucleotide kinase-phosphatase [Treponema sp.]|jgi:protein phosphatase|nr:polynucleotide kinase-phosphatase [Treponema sp.]
MKIEIPELCLVALVGASGSGKSSFAQKHFKPTEVLSSDYFRGLVSDDETDQSATPGAFESLYFIANKRLDSGRLTVIDATNVQKPAREKIIALARAQNVLAAAIVLDMPEALCLERNRLRPDRNFGPHVVRGQRRELKRGLHYLQKEGFRYVYILKSPEEAEAAEIVRTKLWNDKQDESGPFDIIGDIHGCYDELCELLEKLGCTVDRAACTALPPPGRRVIFLGDLCDRGPNNAAVLRLTMHMAESGAALCVPGNHDVKLLRKLQGSGVKLAHGLDITVKELETEPQEFIKRVIRFLDSLVSHYVLDKGLLVVAHAGLSEKLQGRSSGKVRGFCLYGETTGETDEFGLPVRINWAEEYRGRAQVVYGHVPQAEARLLNNTVCVDTGCVFGGKLSAWRYPEKELVSVSAKREYYAPVKPLDHDARQKAEASDEPDIADILGARRIQTRLRRDIPLSEASSALTLEITSRFSADPRWLIYLPPTMSPCGTSALEPFLEHPAEAFGYFKKHGVMRIICEEKHMGSRAVIVLCRDAQTAKTRFGIEEKKGGLFPHRDPNQPHSISGSPPLQPCRKGGQAYATPQGIIYTRTGRHFFDGEQSAHEQAILSRLGAALERSGFWETFSTNWVCLDAELMPWSAKARSLVLEQYAPTGQAGRQGLARAIEALHTAAGIQPQMTHNAGENVSAQFTPAAKGKAENSQGRGFSAGTPAGMDIAKVLQDYRSRLECLKLYTEAYRRYCWPVSSVDDYRVAPFHILATEGKVWHGENHLRHLSVIRDYITGGDPVFTATNHLAVDLADAASTDAAVDWWLKLTNSGGEGMVVKPLDFIAWEEGRLIQPAVKCRGREYLRIIYGPEYTVPERLKRLRKRSLRRKQELALSEFALGMESLERFVNKEPFYRVHECVFAVLALENEAVDPRL